MASQSIQANANTDWGRTLIRPKQRELDLASCHWEGLVWLGAFPSRLLSLVSEGNRDLGAVARAGPPGLVGAAKSETEIKNSLT